MFGGSMFGNPMGSPYNVSSRGTMGQLIYDQRQKQDKQSFAQAEALDAQKSRVLSSRNVPAPKKYPKGQGPRQMQMRNLGSIMNQGQQQNPMGIDPDMLRRMQIMMMLRNRFASGGMGGLGGFSGFGGFGGMF